MFVVPRQRTYQVRDQILFHAFLQMMCVFWNVVHKLGRLTIEEMPPGLGWLFPASFCQVFKVWPFVVPVEAPRMLCRRGGLDFSCQTHFVVCDSRILPISHRPQPRYSVCASDGNTQKHGTALHQLRPWTTEHPHSRDKQCPFNKAGTSGYMLCLPQTQASDRCCTH